MCRCTIQVGARNAKEDVLTVLGADDSALPDLVRLRPASREGEGQHGHFLKGESPESLWLDGVEFDDAVTEDTGETLDIFEPGMENLSDVGQIVIDAILAGEL